MPSTRRVAVRSRSARLVDAGMVAVAVATGGLATRAGGVAAQESALLVEARGGLTAPVGEFASGPRPGEGTGSGASFGVDIGLAGGGRWTPYIGFSQHRFECEAAGCAAGDPYVATGFRAGLRMIPFPGRAVLPWIGLGAFTTHVEAGALGAANAGVSDLGLGGEVGFGVHIGGSSQIALNPAVRLAAVNTRLPGGELLRMRYVVADVAVVLAF